MPRTCTRRRPSRCRACIAPSPSSTGLIIDGGSTGVAPPQAPHRPAQLVPSPSVAIATDRRYMPCTLCSSTEVVYAAARRANPTGGGRAGVGGEGTAGGRVGTGAAGVRLRRRGEVSKAPAGERCVAARSTAARRERAAQPDAHLLLCLTWREAGYPMAA